MKKFALTLLLNALAISLWAAPPQDIGSPASSSAVPLASISREASRATSQGTEDRFTGKVRIVSLFPANAPARATGGQVTFDAGARTAWHAHPVGQTLIVTAGTGRVRFWGGPIQEIKTGDVVWIPPGQKHWHGASPGSPMTHIAVQEQRDGKTDEVLYADIWERQGLSKRDRSLITVSALIAMNRPDQLRSHIGLARQNGLTTEELAEAITHLAFYAGWPSSVTAATIAKDVLVPK